MATFTNIKLYQLTNVTYLFFRYDYMKEKGFPITLDNYKCVYEKVLLNSNVSDIDLMNKLYEVFQFVHPYKGHSVSVSDIFQINDNYYYVESFGFKKLDF